jgi:hypothetical protein
LQRGAKATIYASNVSENQVLIERDETPVMFKRLSERPDRDPSRPGIEFYRRRDVIDLLLPVA